MSTIVDIVVEFRIWISIDWKKGQWFSKWGLRPPAGPPGSTKGASANWRKDENKNANTKINRIF